MAEDQVSVTVAFPRSIVEQIGVSAVRDNHTVEEEIRALVSLALAIDVEPEELVAQAAKDYSEHLATSGQRRPTTDELWQRMREVREEVANELYPD